MDNVIYYDVFDKPFEIFGLYGDVREDGYKRLPDHIGMNVSGRVAELYRHTSGGRIRFKTDAKAVSIKIKGDTALPWHMTNMMRKKLRYWRA